MNDRPVPPATGVAHFAINADDVSRAQRFYGGVFGWQFTAWGPPDFYMISKRDQTDPGIRGSLQKRRELVEGERITGFECSVAVVDIDATAKAVVANGGVILIPPVHIPTVGHIIFFRDTEGNVAGACQYETG